MVEEGDGDAVEGGEVSEVYGSWRGDDVRRWVVGWLGFEDGLVTIERIDAC